jgi:hypothetical protein
MDIRRRTPTPFLLALVAFGVAACEDKNRPTVLDGDVEPPAVVLTSAPDASQANHEVVLTFEVTDDVSLASATVDWGLPGEAPDAFPLAGTRSSVSCGHTFGAAGQYSIAVEARDRSGRSSTATHAIEITEFAPEAPVGLTATVERSNVVLAWAPGAWAESHEITVSRTDAPEEGRVRVIPGGLAATFALTG